VIRPGSRPAWTRLGGTGIAALGFGSGVCHLRVRRLVVATADPGSPPDKATWYLVTNLPRPGGPREPDSPHPAAGLAEIVRIYAGRVLILTTFDLDGYVYAALRAGASGFLLKDTPPAGLLAAIRVIAADDAQLAPAITRRLIAEFARRPEPGRQPAATLEGVTDREREVLTLIARGLSNAEIAQALHVTMATAKTHVGRLLAKVGARDRAQLVMVANETGLVQPGSRGGEPRPVRYLDLFFRTDRGVTAPSQAQLRRGWPRRA
jgi:DNA-binding NarL/FixJ family response regulator